MKRAVLYLRRSSEKQGSSIADQRTHVRKFAESAGVEVVGEFVDDGISGASADARPAFQRMIAEAEAPGRKWDAILCFDVSRFSRGDTDEAGFFRHRLRTAGVEVVYTAENFRGDFSDEFMRPLKQVFAHQYVRDLARLTIRGQVGRVEQGRWGGGRPAYGFDLRHFDEGDRPYRVTRFLDDGHREVRFPDGSLDRIVPPRQPLGLDSRMRSQLVPGDPAKVAVVRRIFDAYVREELGFCAVAARLNVEGVPSPWSGKDGSRGDGAWSGTTIRAMLTNPAYRGDTAWNKMTFARFSRISNRTAAERPRARMNKVERNPESEWIVRAGTHEALVAPEVFERAKRLMKLRGGTTSAGVAVTSKPSDFLLSGLVTCARCGARYQGYTTWKGKPKKDGTKIATKGYICAGYLRKGAAVCVRHVIPKQEFEAVVFALAVERLAAFVRDDGARVVEELIAEHLRSVGGDDEAALVAKADATRKEIDRYVACLTPELASVLGEKIAALKRESERQDARLEDLRASRAATGGARELMAAAIAHAKDVGATLADASFFERREFLRGVLASVTVDAATNEARAAFYALPRLALKDEEPSRSKAMTALGLMAGAGLPDPKRTFRLPRRSFWARKAA